MKYGISAAILAAGLGLTLGAIADSAETPTPEKVSGGDQATEKWVPADGEQLAFRIKDGRKTIGELTLDFSYDDDEVLHIQRENHFTASRFFMSFSMDQSMKSEWRGDKLVYLKNDMAFNTPMGDQDFTFEATEGQFGDLEAQTEAGPRIIPGDAYPETFWNAGFLEKDRFFRAYMGQETTPSFRKSGHDYVRINGEEVTCARYDITTQNLQGEETTNQYWYEENGRLCKMAFTNPAGTFVYERQ